MHSIPFSEFGRVYLHIAMKPKDDTVMQPVEFKVDTGADKTTISKRSLLALDYDIEWINQNAVIFSDEDKPTTASGDKINAGYIMLPLINILGYEGKSWPFQIIMDMRQDFRNLLGRDLLTGFNYNFDNDSRIFTIKRTNFFNPIYEFLPEQEINELTI